MENLDYCRMRSVAAFQTACRSIPEPQAMAIESALEAIDETFFGVPLYNTTIMRPDGPVVCKEKKGCITCFVKGTEE